MGATDADDVVDQTASQLAGFGHLTDGSDRCAADAGHSRHRNQQCSFLPQGEVAVGGDVGVEPGVFEGGYELIDT